jgi:hypothetical protein
MGASSPLTLSVDSVTALRAVAEQPSEVQRFEVARRSRATKPSQAKQSNYQCYALIIAELGSKESNPE